MDSRKIPFRGRMLAALGLVLALIVTLPGCSGLAGLGAEPVELTFVYFENAADYAPLAESFHEKYPNITIKLDPVPGGQDGGSRAMAMKAETADAIRISSTMLNEQMVAAFLPLDTYITTDKNFPQGDLITGSLEGLQVGGKQFGLPAALNPYVVFYDPQKFSASGVAPPSAGWMLEDFMTTAMAINNADEALVGTQEYTFGYCGTPQFFDPVMFAYIFGGGVFDSITSPTRPTLNLDANIQSLEWYASLRNEFGIMPGSDEARAVGELVVRSNCGFWLDWLDRSSFGRWMNDRNLAALPLPNYTSTFSVSTIETYSIMSTSLHPDETYKWIAYLMEQPTASGRLIPALRSVIDSEEYARHAPADVLGVARAMPQQAVVLGLEMYQDPRLGGVLELYADAATKVMAEEMDARTALDIAQQQAQAAFGP